MNVAGTTKIWIQKGITQAAIYSIFAAVIAYAVVTYPFHAMKRRK